MSTRKRVKLRQKHHSQQIWQRFSTWIKKLVKWLLRSLLIISRRRRKQAKLSKSGFVLPTVAMVSLVVILLTTAMMIRSFDRSRDASNARASQAVINAAAPAIARAKVKIDELLKEPTLRSETPSDLVIYNTIQNNPRYTFGDETRLKLAFDINQDNNIQAHNTELEQDETLTTAWRFAVDTDNNGKFDSFTLYGIYFRNPSRVTTGDAKGNFNRPRTPLEARTPPMADQAIDSRCADILGTSTSVVGDSGWYQSGSNLKKSFFVYTAIVPITNTTGLGTQFETATSRGFSALEYQQDRSRTPLNNHAVWFNNDLEIAPDSEFRLNGSIHTNGNLLVAGRKNTPIRFYQVSSTNSCFYQEENGKITVGGNVGIGNVTDTVDQNVVEVDLFDEDPTNGNAQIDSRNKSTDSQGGSQIAYNDAAYNQRIALMKRAALLSCLEDGKYCSEINPPEINTVLAIQKYPNEVKNRFEKRLTDHPSLNTYNVLTEEIELYLKNRTRRVPFAEVPEVDGDTSGLYVYNEQNVFTTSTNSIEPPTEWREPTDTNTELQLRTRQLEATFPEQQKRDGKETRLGDRLIVGNNLPAAWKDGDKYVTAPNDQQSIPGINWTEPNNQPRYRSTQVQQLDNLAIADRDNFWEEKAAENPTNTLANSGGLRIITGAGIYQHKDNTRSTIKALQPKSFLPDLPRKLNSGKDIPNLPEDLILAGERVSNTKYTLVWSDMMPMTGGSGTNSQGQLQLDDKPSDLRMRATAAYHYMQSSGVDQVPIACISSYYDPTDETSARNGRRDTAKGFPWGDGGQALPANPANPGSDGRSNNGVVYAAPYTSNDARISAIAAYLPELKKQAMLMFPNGRIVNQPLQQALQKLNASGSLTDVKKPLSLSENSAIDTAICSLKILDGTINPITNPTIPHGAIREASFLDGRQLKALSKESDTDENSDATIYNLELEQRQPLEIRVTEIDLDTDERRGITRKLLPNQNEYVLPDSGIIYASRNDALLDASDTSPESKLLSPTDFKLDPTRRPNGIRLINGRDLSRTPENTYREAEKGLILVSNLPVYIKGDFNLHRTPRGNTDLEEFVEKLQTDNWGNFYSRNTGRDPNFACRPGQTGCPNSEGDTWRPTTVVSDAITLLSSSFRDGFRNQGDYDLNNYAGGSTTQEADNNGTGTQKPDNSDSAAQKRKNQGFWDNNFVTSAAWGNTNNGDNAYPDKNTISSYLANGVTPIQRRTNFPEYVMEICRKIPVSECTQGDWFVGYDDNGNGRLENTEINRTVTAQTLSKIPKAEVGKLGAGTTAQPALMESDRRYPRRIAFINPPPSPSASTNLPIPLGINGVGMVQQYGSGTPREVANALWFKTTTNPADPTQGGAYSANSPLFMQERPTGQQPLLVPVLQIHSPDGSPGSSLARGNPNRFAANWLQTAAADTTFNATFVSGNTPGRPQEESGGLQNFVRFLENWQQRTVNISGNFIQPRRSAYATAPFIGVLPNSNNLSLFDYPTEPYTTANNRPASTVPYYSAPTRQWTFDVALLSQSPDLFAQKFTTPAPRATNEFFREVGRDDPWIETLLCSATASDRVGTATATYSQYAVADPNQRPAKCQATTPNYPANNPGQLLQIQP